MSSNKKCEVSLEIIIIECVVEACNAAGMIELGPIKAETTLYGNQGILDSLGLVTALIGIQRDMERKLGVTATIIDESVFSQNTSAFATVGSLVKYVRKRIERS